MLKERITIILFFILVVFICDFQFVQSATYENISLIEKINNKNTFIVDNEGDGDFVSIQDAINQSNDGCIIEVYSGRYNENVRINKQILLIGIPHELGEGNDTGKPIISGFGEIYSPHVVEIFADNCIIKGFLIENGGTAVSINGENTIFSYNSIFNSIRGVSISNEGNGSVIHNNTFFNNSDIAIFVQFSCNLGILNNSIFEGKCGIKIDFSFVVFDHPTGIILRDNSLINCGLCIKGRSMQNYYIDVDTSNTINGRPIYYLLNETEMNISVDAGQIFLINCSSCNISNCFIESGYNGILLAFSHHNIIKENVISNQSLNGIYLEWSSNNIIENNIIYRNGRNGICLQNSDGNIIRFNHVSLNMHDGIYIGWNSNNTNVSRNTVTKNYGFGISLAYCFSNLIAKNLIKNNGEGVGIYCSAQNEVMQNNIHKNEGWCIQMEDCIYNKIHHNNLIKFGYHAMLINSFFNLWYRNYWSNWYLPLPKPIIGITVLYPGAKPLPWINFDLFPRIFPYGW